MKKAIACLLVLPLALAACGAQTTQPAPTTAPEMTTEATTENGKSAPAEVNQPGITGRMSMWNCRRWGYFTAVWMKWSA